MEYVNTKKKMVSGYKITWAPAVLRHFSAHLEPLPIPVQEEKDDEIDEIEDFAPSMRGMSFRRPSYQFV